MNKEVSFEIAKLLKEKSFDVPVYSYYISTGELIEISEGDEPRRMKNSEMRVSISAPTIVEIVMWLYEKQNIWITAKPGSKLETWDFIVQKKDNSFAVPYFEIKQHKPFFNSPTEAYEAAILYTLNNLI